MNNSAEPLFFTDLRLRNTYSKNKRFYRWRTIPFIGKHIPKTIYGNRALENFFLALGIAGNVIGTFIRPLIYLFLVFFIAVGASGGGAFADVMVYLEIISEENAATASPEETLRVFLHILVCLTLIGGVLNNGFLDTGEETGYAVLLLRMNPRKYAIAEMIFKCGKIFLGTLPAILILRLLSGMSLLAALLFPVFVIEMKILCAAIELKINDLSKDNPGKQAVRYSLFIVFAVLAGAAAAFCSLRIADAIGCRFMLPLNTIPVASAVLLVPAGLAFTYLNSYKNYYGLYKMLLFRDAGENTATAEIAGASAVLSSKALRDDIEKHGIEHTSSTKEGLAYFNEIFVRRHMSLLIKPAFKISIIMLIVGIIACALVIFVPHIAERMPNFIRNDIMVFPILLYAINRGEAITRAMFVNCDASMLHFRFYRQPATVLKLFWMRLKVIVLINMIPTAIIALSVFAVCLLSDMSAFESICAFAAIIFMGIFFSIHYLGMYYLLQPYTIGADRWSKTYSIVHALVYFIIYEAMNVGVSLSMAAPVIVIFSVIYTIVITLLIGKFAPKTFRLKSE